MNNEFLKMTVDASIAAYMSDEKAMQYVRRYFNNVDDYEHFENNESECLCFKDTQSNYIIAFRGTHGRKDAITDMKTWQTDSDTIGDVHYGFKQYLDNLYGPLLTWLEKNIVLEQQRKVIITGHSLGAAAATIMTSRLKQKGYNVVLYTYGSPRVGDKEFAKQFQNIEAYRIVNNNDIVSSIPFNLFFWYEHVGELKYLNYHGDFVDWGLCQRILDQLRSRWRSIQKLQLFDGTYDHSLGLYRDKIYNWIKDQKS